MKRPHDEIRNSFREGSLRWTGPRRAVTELFIKCAGHLSAADVYRKLAASGVDKASVYRNLEVLRRRGVLVLSGTSERERRYELSERFRPHHHHLVCQSCGDVEEIEGCGLRPLEARILRKKKFKVEAHELKFLGVCRKCHT
ncbi:MAG: Fur family transcriptional regulator [Candidatus Omnitrophota bacterium]